MLVWSIIRLFQSALRQNASTIGNLSVPVCNSIESKSVSTVFWLGFKWDCLIFSPHDPYTKVRAKYVQNPYKIRVLHVLGNPTRTGGVKIHQRGVFFRTEIRTKYVFLGVLGPAPFWGKSHHFGPSFPDLEPFPSCLNPALPHPHWWCSRCWFRALERVESSPEHEKIGIQNPKLLRAWEGSQEGFTGEERRRVRRRIAEANKGHITCLFGVWIDAPWTVLALFPSVSVSFPYQPIAFNHSHQQDYESKLAKLKSNVAHAASSNVSWSHLLSTNCRILESTFHEYANACTWSCVLSSHPKPKVGVYKEQYAETDTIPASWHQLGSVMNLVISEILLEELSKKSSMLWIRQLKRNCVSPWVERSAQLRKQNQLPPKWKANGLTKANLPQSTHRNLKQHQHLRHTARQSSHHHRRRWTKAARSCLADWTSSLQTRNQLAKWSRWKRPHCVCVCVMLILCFKCL